jgi:hypothetical protein
MHWNRSIFMLKIYGNAMCAMYATMKQSATYIVHSCKKKIVVTMQFNYHQKVDR